MDVIAGNSAASLDGKLLNNLAVALRNEVMYTEAGKPAQPKYEVTHYSNLGGFLIISAPNGSAIARVSESNGTGEATQITSSHFPEFLQDLEKLLKQMGRKLMIEDSTPSSDNFGISENVYEALAGIPLGTGLSQYRT